MSMPGPLNINIPPSARQHQQPKTNGALAPSPQSSSSPSPSPKLQRKRKASETDPAKPSTTTTPLDLSKSPTSAEEQDNDENMDSNARNNRSQQPSPADVGSRKTSPAATAEVTKEQIEQQQREIEAHLNFLKVKHLEFIKSQQQQQQQQQAAVVAAAAAAASESRCEECNINFSKHQNYLAHKKYYCSAGGAKPKAGEARDRIVDQHIRQRQVAL